MRFRIGLIIGGAVGYILGAKAGRQRYEDIVARWRRLKSHPAAEQLAARVTDVVDMGRSAVADGLRQGSDELRRIGD